MHEWVCVFLCVWMVEICFSHRTCVTWTILYLFKQINNGWRYRVSETRNRRNEHDGSFRKRFENSIGIRFVLARTFGMFARRLFLCPLFNAFISFRSHRSRRGRVVWYRWRGIFDVGRFCLFALKTIQPNKYGYGFIFICICICNHHITYTIHPVWDWDLPKTKKKKKTQTKMTAKDKITKICYSLLAQQYNWFNINCEQTAHSIHSSRTIVATFNNENSILRNQQIY